MKKNLLKLLLLFVGLVVGIVQTHAQASYNATYTQGVTVSEGTDFFLYNIGAKMFLTDGMTWGTHATVDHAGRIITLATTSAGKYSIYTQSASVNNNAEAKAGFMTLNGYLDTGTNNANWEFTPVSISGYTNAYTIKNSNTEYLVFNPADCFVNVGESTNNANSYWLLIPKTDREDNGDYTYLLQNTDFNRNGSGEGNNCRLIWKKSSNVDANLCGGSSENRCGEFWHKNLIVSQTISASIPNGRYKLYAQGFYSDTDTPALLFANDATTPFGKINANNEGTATSMDGASASFSAGKYTMNVTVDVTDNALTVGVKDETGGNWVIFDNFHLFRVVDLSAYKTDYEAQVAGANKLISSGLLTATEEESITNAINTSYTSFASVAQYRSAMNVLTKAVNDLEAKTFYIKNKATDKYWGAGNSWGTQASLVDEYQYVKLHAMPEGTYTMESMVSNGGTKYYFGPDGFMDNETPVKLTITKSGENFLIANGDNYFGYDGETTVLGKDLAATSENALWEVLLEEEIEAEKTALKTSATEATLAAPADLTALIQDANFGRNRRDASEAWTIEANNKNLGGGGSDGNGCAESYHSAFTMTQNLTDLPNGLYKVIAQGFYRQDGNSEEDTPVFTANGEEEKFLPMGASLNGKTNGLEMGDAGIDFSKGKFTSNPIYVNVTDGKLTIGAKGTATNQWVIWDNFQLFYCGDSKDAYVASLKAQLTEDDAKTAFDEAVAGATTIDAIEAALQTAIRSQKTEGADYTATIVNPSFEAGDLRGWTLNSNSYDKGVFKNEEKYATENFDGEYLFNIWSDNGLGGDLISQTIDLPNGLYTLKAVAATDAEHSVLLMGNGKSAEIVGTGKETGIEGELTFAVTDGKAIIGAQGKDKYWYKVDNFRLTYAGDITEVSNMTDLIASEGAVNFKITDLQVVLAGNDSIVAQDMTGETAVGILLKGTKGVNGANGAAMDKIFSGQLYGVYDAETHAFTIETNSSNKMELANGKTEATKMEPQDVAEADNAYLLTQIELATIVKKGDDYYAEKSGANNAVKIDDRLCPGLTLVEGDVVNSILGVTFLEDGVSVLAPLSQDDVVPLLWTANNMEEGDNVSVKPIDLTTKEKLKRMATLTTGDALYITAIKENEMVSRAERRNSPAPDEPDGYVYVQTAGGEEVFGIPFNINNETEEAVIEVPITDNILDEVNNHGLKIAVQGAKAKMVTVSNKVFTENTENSIWLSSEEAGSNVVLLGAFHFSDVRESDVVTADVNKMYTEENVEILSGEVLTEEKAAALLDHGLAVTGARYVTLTLGENRPNIKSKAAAGDFYAQGEMLDTEEAANGLVMAFGGDDPEGANYEFEEAYPKVNKFAVKTEGINTFPVDDENKAYDPEKKNLPTKGTYYVFEPTKDGKLEVTVDLEEGKKLYVTEDGEALKKFNGITKVEGNKLTFDVEAAKSYYVFANETNLAYYGFTFVATDPTAKNTARNIAVFKHINPSDGDKLILKDAVVTYIKSDDVYVEDESGATIFYKTNIQFYAGQKLNGYIIGTNAMANYMPQLQKTEGTKYNTFKVTEKVEPEAKTISVAEIAQEKNLASFVKIENLEVQKDDKGFTILKDTETGNAIRIQDHFNVFYKLNSNVTSIEGIIGVNNEGDNVIWPTSKEGVNSPQPTIANLADGKYLLKNIASGLYWGAGNDWGTRASLIKQPDFVTLLQQPEGTYHLESQVSNGGTAIYFEGDYMDNGTPKALTINDMGDGTYTIASGDKCYGYDNSTVLGKDLIANDKNARWEIISLEDATAAMSEATEENPVDVTFLVLDSDFGRNHRNGKGLSTNSNQFKNADLDAAWTFNADNKNNAGKNENWNVESWHSVFTMSQTIENVPNGIYEMTAQGFYRQDDGQTEDLPVFYINDGEQTFLEGGSENSMDMASESFSAGKYFCEPIRVTVVDHTITLGAKGTATHQWCIWDNFQLKYLGPDPDALKLAAEAYEKALADAEALAKEKMSKKALAALTAVIDANSDIDETSEDAIEAAMKALNDGMKAAQPSVNSYKVIAAGAVADNSLDGWSWTNAQGLAVNTWSVEGNEGNDPTGMVVPFIQSWVSKPGPLGEGKLLYTLKDVDPAKVKVTALVRVYSESGNEPAGVTFFAGDKTIADIAEVGEAFEFNGMKGIYTTVEGTGTVNEDGDFVFGFEIADPTFNWIAIKNVTIDYDDDPTAINGVATVRYENGAVYNLNGQKVNSLKKGLYIVNGKKVVIK